MKDLQFHVADTALLGKDPIIMFHVAKILARRLVVANKGLVKSKNELKAGSSPSLLSKMLIDIEQILSVGGSTFEQWI